MRQHMSRRAVGSLGLIGVSVVLGAAPAQAQNQSMTLKGAVAQSCTLGITASGSYNHLSLTGAQSNVAVGTSIESCNDGKGYVVTIGTANGTRSAVFKGIAHSQTLAYGVNYGSTNTLTFAGSTATATNTRAAGFRTMTVGVTYGSGTALLPDTYTDTLTFTLRVN